MKKNTLLYIALIILVLLSVYYFLNQKSTTIKKELSDFAIEDTSAITKIFMADKLNKQVTIVRKEKYWEVDGKYRARKDAINIVLSTIKDLTVKSPVPKASLENQIKRIAAKSVKVEIYTNNSTKPSKVFYVGGGTTDNQGTYMLLENSSKPFIMYVPGFFGYLSTRFFTDGKLWKDNSIFKSEFNEIKSIKLEYPKTSEKSFVINNLGNYNFELINLSTNTKANNINNEEIKRFVGNFTNFGYEAPISNIKPEKKDSLLKAIPENIYTVTLTNGKHISLKLYNISVSNEIKEKYQAEFEFDPDRMYGFFNNDEELVTVQTQLIYPVIKEIKDFIPSK
jgi:hypothetical protein